MVPGSCCSCTRCYCMRASAIICDALLRRHGTALTPVDPGVDSTSYFQWPDRVVHCVQDKEHIRYDAFCAVMWMRLLLRATI
eukprot:scaffold5056_cov119-Skeletonema_dohrnii-CCMP3373.AAC.2